MYRRAIIGSLVLLHAAVGSAQELPAASTNASSTAVEQAIYKGIVGNLLDVVPLEPKERVHLQRANAILGTPFSARSLALLLGISSPPLMVLGAIWGLWSASKIQATESPAPPGPNPLTSALRVAEPGPVALAPSADERTPANDEERPALDRAQRSATASELDAIVASGQPGPVLPCENCYQQIMDAKVFSISR